MSLCLLTFGMLTTSISMANISCSDFDPVEPPVQVVSLDPTFVPQSSKDDVDVPKLVKTITPDPKRTAIYDISARSVIMPSGEKLEAHSGLSWRRDDPKYVRDKSKGPTPPNHYKLSLRERLFHGIKAIRLNPVYEDKMHGRDGILAHPYMLGDGGDSYGCVSLKNYDKFLKEYLSGKITDMIVVRSSDEVKQHYASN